MVGLEGRNQISLDVMIYGVEQAVSELNFLGKQIIKNAKMWSYNVDNSLSTLENSLENTTKHASDLSSEFKDLQINSKIPLDILENSLESTTANASDLSSEFKDLMKAIEIPKVEQPFKMPDNVFDGVTKGATAFSKEIYDAQGKTIGLNRTITETTGLGMQNIVNTTQRWDSANKKWVTTNKQMTIGAKSFRMEALGVMFAGMGVTRMFGGLTQGGIEWLGIGPMLTDAFSLMTYSAIEPFSNSLYGASSAFLKLDEAQKESMGEFLIAGQIGGMALQTFGSLILALSSMSQLFGDSPIFMGAATTALGLMLGKVSDFVSVIPGMEGIGAAMKIMSGATAVAGGFKTIKAILDIQDIGIAPAAAAALSSKIAAIPILPLSVGLIYAYDSFKAITEGEFTSGLTSALSSVALLGVATKRFDAKTGTVLVGIGAVITIVDAIADGTFGYETVKQALKDAKIPLAVMAASSGTPQGFAIAAVLVFSDVIFDIAGALGEKLASSELGKAIYKMIKPFESIKAKVDVESGVSQINAAAQHLQNVQNKPGYTLKYDPFKNPSGLPWGDFIVSNGVGHSISPDDTVIGKKDWSGTGNNYYNTFNFTISGTSGNDRQLAERIGEIVTDKFRNMTNR